MNYLNAWVLRSIGTTPPRMRRRLPSKDRFHRSRRAQTLQVTLRTWRGRSQFYRHSRGRAHSSSYHGTRCSSRELSSPGPRFGPTPTWVPSVLGTFTSRYTSEPAQSGGNYRRSTLIKLYAVDCNKSRRLQSGTHSSRRSGPSSDQYRIAISFLMLGFVRHRVPTSGRSHIRMDAGPDAMALTMNVFFGRIYQVVWIVQTFTILATLNSLSGSHESASRP